MSTQMDLLTRVEINYLLEAISHAARLRSAARTFVIRNRVNTLKHDMKYRRKLNIDGDASSPTAVTPSCNFSLQ